MIYFWWKKAPPGPHWKNGLLCSSVRKKAKSSPARCFFHSTKKTRKKKPFATNRPFRTMPGSLYPFRLSSVPRCQFATSSASKAKPNSLSALQSSIGSNKPDWFTSKPRTVRPVGLPPADPRVCGRVTHARGPRRICGGETAAGKRARGYCRLQVRGGGF